MESIKLDKYTEIHARFISNLQRGELGWTSFYPDQNEIHKYKYILVNTYMSKNI